MNFTARTNKSAVVEEGGSLVQLVVEEDIDKVLVVTWRSTRLMLGVDCFLLQLPLADGGSREWLLQEAGGLRGVLACRGRSSTLRPTRGRRS